MMVEIMGGGKVRVQGMEGETILIDVESSEVLQERDTYEIGREKRELIAFLVASAAAWDHTIGGDGVLCAPSAAMEVPSRTGAWGTETGV